MAKIILAGCLGIVVGWAATSYDWQSRCLIQNVKFKGGIMLDDGNVDCTVINNKFNLEGDGLVKIGN